MTHTDEVKSEPALRQWTNKLVCGLAVLVMGFVSVWATYIKGSMDTFDTIQRTNVERIVRLEERQVSVKDSLAKIEENQGEMQKMLNRIALGIGLKIEGK
jgi:hypothetical protein